MIVITIYIIVMSVDISYLFRMNEGIVLNKEHCEYNTLLYTAALSDSCIQVVLVLVKMLMSCFSMALRTSD